MTSTRQFVGLVGLLAGAMLPCAALVAQPAPRLLADGPLAAAVAGEHRLRPGQVVLVQQLEEAEAAFRAACLPWPQDLALAANEQLLVLRLAAGVGRPCALLSYRMLQQPDLRLLRLQAVGKAAAPGHLLAIAVPASFGELGTSLGLELQPTCVGTEAVPGRPPAAVQRLVAVPMPSPIPQIRGGELATAPVACLRIRDWLAWQAAWRSYGPAGAALPVFDFANSEVLLLPGDGGHGVVWQPDQPAAAAVPAAPPLLWRQQPGSPQPAGVPGSWRELPRQAGPLHVEAELAHGQGLVELQQLAVPTDDPELLPVWRAEVLAVPLDLTAGVDAATSVTEWRQLCQRLGIAGGPLLVDSTDYAVDWLVVVRTGAAMRWPGCTLRVATEEGVDVLVVSTRAPSGRELPVLAEAVVLKLPRRAAQLAIVWEQHCGPAPPQQTTLAVLPRQQDH